MTRTTLTDGRTAATLAAVAMALCIVTVGGVAGVGVTDTPDGATAGVEPNDAPGNATPLAYGETVTAELAAGEEDWYAVDGRAGRALVARLELRESFPGSAIQVDVVDPDGTVGTEIPNDGIDGPPNVAGAERPVDARATAVGVDVMETNETYYVRVSESRYNETDDDAVYRYNLTVGTETLDAYEPNEDGRTATPIELGETVDAVLTGHDSDVYAVNATAGRTYNVTVETQNHTHNLEKQLIVYDHAADAVDDPDRAPNGTPVAYDEHLFEGTVSFTAERNGTYYVQLVEGDTNPYLFQRSNYSLTVNETSAPPVDGGDGDGPGELPPEGDADGDGLANAREDELGTDPRDADTDGDGRRDDCELRDGTDPTDPADRV